MNSTDTKPQGGDQTRKSIKIPFIDGLEMLEAKEFESAMKEKASKGKIDAVSWPGLYPYCPECSFKIARSRKYLAVSYEVEGMDLRATAMCDNSRSWEDSCCEFFISTGEGGYYNFEVTCIGSVLAGYGPGRSDRILLPEDQVCRVVRRSTLEHRRYECVGGNYKWGVTILIPFDLIGLEPERLPEYAEGNFYKCADLSAHPHFVSWNRVGSPEPDFHRPEFFGKLVF